MLVTASHTFVNKQKVKKKIKENKRKELSIDVFNNLKIME